MSISDYYRLTLRQYQLLVEGYQRDLERKRVANLEEWRRARLIAFYVAAPNLEQKHMSIYQFYKLPDDPTDQEIAEAKKEQVEVDGKWAAEQLRIFKENKRKKNA